MMDLKRMSALVVWAVVLAAQGQIVAPGLAKSSSADVDRILDQHADDPKAQAYERRLKDLSRVEEQVAAGIEGLREQSLQGLLDALDPVGSGAATASGMSGAGATFILDEFASSLDGDLPLPGDDVEARELLEAFYRDQVAAAQERVAEHIRRALPVANDRYARLVEFYAVLPFLHGEDDAWAEEDLAAFPDWLLEADAREVLEELALQHNRPRTAYVFGTYGSSAAEATANDLLDYFLATAERMEEGGRFRAALHLLRAGRDRADEGRKAEFHFALAELLANGGHPQLAAEELGDVLADTSEPEVFGRAAVLRLKHLFEAGDRARVLREFEALASDERIRLHEPQLLYIAWVAARQENEQRRAERLQERFLDRYPEHPLGADIHFALATGAMASTRYDVAMEHLETIQDRYPNYQHLRRVQDLYERLQDVE